MTEHECMVLLVRERSLEPERLGDVWTCPTCGTVWTSVEYLGCRGWHGRRS